jgi:hypothetical protein
MARKRATGPTTKRGHAAQRKLPPGPRRAVHVTLPVETARRLRKIACERDVPESVLVYDLIEACPIRPDGAAVPVERDDGS